jgi:acyl dehydratase
MGVVTSLTPLAGMAALTANVGRLLGHSDWMVIDQARIDAFAEATGDHQWIHVDAERAARESPYGATIAHGFLTLSLLPALGAQAYAVEGVRGRINYGLNRVRFPAPVKAGSRLRGAFRLVGVEPQGAGRHLITVEATVEIEGGERPACIAEMLALYIE